MSTSPSLKLRGHGAPIFFGSKISHRPRPIPPEKRHSCKLARKPQARLLSRSKSHLPNFGTGYRRAMQCGKSNP